MKLQSKQWMLAAILFASINVSAQTIVPLDENAMYFTADELPDATVWLPAPPDTLSTQFVYDVTQYMWGKTQREDPQSWWMSQRWPSSSVCPSAWRFPRRRHLPFSMCFIGVCSQHVLQPGNRSSPISVFVHTSVFRSLP